MSQQGHVWSAGIAHFLPSLKALTRVLEAPGIGGMRISVLSSPAATSNGWCTRCWKFTLIWSLINLDQHPTHVRFGQIHVRGPQLIRKQQRSHETPFGQWFSATAGVAAGNAGPRNGSRLSSAMTVPSSSPTSTMSLGRFPAKEPEQRGRTQMSRRVELTRPPTMTVATG